MEPMDIKKKIMAGYGRVATENRSCCGPSSFCCGAAASIQAVGELIGYSKEEMSQVPEGANLGLGCGNPVALASLEQGQTVLDLGSGAGFDCFLAARAVGEKGRVIGVDMTPEMVEKARANADKGGYRNVEFRLGEIEQLPVSDNTVDVILSNCVVNLSPDKRKVFSEAIRVLKPGGKLTLSDVVLLSPLPPAVASSAAAYLGCVAGASLRSDYFSMLGAAGFSDVQVVGESPFHLGETVADPIVQELIQEAGLSSEQVKEIAKSIVSIKLVATKAAGLRS